MKNNQDKTLYVFLGNYGSGKTELSLNCAFGAAERGEKTVLLDMDIVNPYFRSSERREELEEKGIRTIAPVFANTNVDIPALSPEVQSVFVDDTQAVVFDVGGDPVGATAMGRYKQLFDAARDVRVCFVVNTRRPMTDYPEDICLLMEQIQRQSRLTITELINNTNLGSESSEQDLIMGQETLEQVSARTGVPITAITGEQTVIDMFDAETNGQYRELLKPVKRYMALDWL